MTSDQSFSFESTDRPLDIARTHARTGRLLEAERAYRRVLDSRPDHIEALRFLANAALSRNNAGDAIALLSRAVQADRSSVGTLLELGTAYQAAQRLDEARSVLELALQVSGGHHPAARLLLANVLEADGRPDVALLNYFRAVLDAQGKDEWLSDATTEPGLRNMVRHAMQYVEAGRRALFDRALEPLRTGINAARLGRINAALAAYLREQPMRPADPGQRPSFLYLPDLGANRFLDNTSFDWIGDWTGSVATLDAEASACIDNTRKAALSEPVFSLKSMASDNHAGVLPLEPCASVMYERGMFQGANGRLAPRMAQLLDSLPLMRIPDYAPDARILDLPSATRTLPCYGRSNAFCTVVTAFSGSAPLLVVVGGESRQLHPSETLVFDPSFEFTFAGTGAGRARVLMFDTWNPGVSPLERDAVTALAVTAVDFDRRLRDLA